MPANEALWERVRRHVVARSYRDCGSGIEDAVFLAGTPRSGTTWLAELLTYGLGWRYIYEPFNPHSPYLARPGHRRRFPEAYVRFLERARRLPYRSPEDPDEELDAAVAPVLAGHVRHWWLDRFNLAWRPRKRLLKDVHSNLLLPWLRRRFPSMPIIWLVRHPFAVAYSRMRLGWPSFLAEWHADAMLSSALGSRLTRGSEHAAGDLFAEQVLGWAVETYVPLMHLQPADVLLVHYEHLRAQPEDVLARLRAYLALSPKDLPQLRARLRRPSAMARPTRKAPMDWRTAITEQSQQRAQAVVAEFGLDRLYDVANVAAKPRFTSGQWPRLGGS